MGPLPLFLILALGIGALRAWRRRSAPDSAPPDDNADSPWPGTGAMVDGYELAGPEGTYRIVPRLEDLHPIVKTRVDAFLGQLRDEGFAPLPYEVGRLDREQARLYAQGRTAPGNVVTKLEKPGAHGLPNAWGLDIVDGRKGPSGRIYAWGRPEGEAAPGAFFLRMAELAPLFDLESLGPSSLGDWVHIQAVEGRRPDDVA